MDNDLKKLITESLDEFFESAPMKMVERGERIQTYDICPHCKKEIYERHEYTEDGGKTWRHSECKGLIDRPEQPLEEFAKWLQPIIKAARDSKKSAQLTKEVLPPEGDLPVGGEEKYLKQQPGGMMSTCNVDGPAWGEGKK